MAELLLELFSEEIPARMQARAAEDLRTAFLEAFGTLIDGGQARAYWGPRRIALHADGMIAETPGATVEERGPRSAAPEAALAGFLKKHGAAREELAEESGYWVLRRTRPPLPTAEALAARLPALIRKLAWPKSMRWGVSPFPWVRPLRRILCVFDGAVVPFALAEGADDAHGLASGDLTEGHRIQAPGAFAVRGFADYAAKLHERFVVLDDAERERLVEEGVTRLAAAEGFTVMPDRGLVSEVAGLVEWPVPLLARIDDAFMDLPPEVMRTTMRVNQRYFTLVTTDGRAAPRFALAANIAASDGGAAIAAGNERVLRARLSDARFFWDQDRKQRLEDFLPKLDAVVFHARLGTQGQRVARLEKLAALIATRIGADAALSARAAKLAKADLASGMVGEFPELQGVMGRYYAQAAGEDARVAEAIGAHYRPLGPGDAVPAEPIAISVALADKIDQLVGFFAADERPTGSGDPFALRRAALGVIRIIRENGLRLALADIFAEAFFLFPAATGSTAVPEFGMTVAAERMKAGFVPPAGSPHPPMVAAFAAGLLDFLAERLRVQLRAEGARHDIVAAVFSAGADDDLNRLLARADAVRDFLDSDNGANLLAAAKRAQNILRIEEKKDGAAFEPEFQVHHNAPVQETALCAALDSARHSVAECLPREDFAGAMAAMATLRTPLDAFFEGVIVNDPDSQLRRNRLRLLAGLRAVLDQVADFSKIEG
ncbi:glycine--tRNA ligase subunit beta [Roseomonas hellenica]|uniref:Glycine--tRNA ligase beta subunit n=1 Tax=Plastoroseomonas hellenica TaxID=2687306 RepID=A0ABS5F0Y9_9PROT|nr:glycine--tRNA ligase subunit beta [Plastoroseomonas hellenica]MBR0666214.1 glycine--tRNA ligase subunit beta [Plastoroseomonas hellenica]